MNVLNGTSSLRINPFEGRAPSLGNSSTAVLHLSTESPLHSGFFRRPPATLEKRIPIHKAVFSGSLNSAGIGLFISNEIWIIKVKVTMKANILTHFDLLFFMIILNIVSVLHGLLQSLFFHRKFLLYGAFYLLLIAELLPLLILHK